MSWPRSGVYGVTVALMHWGGRWCFEDPPLHLTHAADGGRIEQILRCTCCGQDVDARKIRYEQTDDDLTQE
ncbi:hypothetical protein OG921_21545 [Aldersonia sp. NBC_00410]|uniref:hypothetical protein n=1 Tax=Aldersonia sp. NBC_00410 TaxID=2975954 RepID=UPI0022577286|nr:hypothetical protein [Aldersonia sp. NBC_00410]MCX5045754.1 hypothetical protein [Aldersonia sp. NBC_00410]